MENVAFERIEVLVSERGWVYDDGVNRWVHVSSVGMDENKNFCVYADFDVVEIAPMCSLRVEVIGSVPYKIVFWESDPRGGSGKEKIKFSLHNSVAEYRNNIREIQNGLRISDYSQRQKERLSGLSVEELVISRESVLLRFSGGLSLTFKVDEEKESPSCGMLFFIEIGGECL